MSSPNKTGFADHFSTENLISVFEEKIRAAKFSGVDGITAEAFEKRLGDEIALIQKKVMDGTYKFTRYKEKLILKSAAKPPRQISIPTIRDALTLRVLCDYLNVRFSERRMHPPHDCIKKINLAVSNGTDKLCIVRLDVVNFYPTINHDILFSKIASSDAPDIARALISAAIKTPTGSAGNKANAVGIPQGLSISNILSMIYFTDADKKLSKAFNYFRYVDDIIVLCKESVALKTHDKVVNVLSKDLCLVTHALNEETLDKTSIRKISDGTDYLGFTISDQKLRIREKSYKKMFRAIVGCLRGLESRKRKEHILWRLNLIVTGCRFEKKSVGWVFFFRQSEDMKQFHRMDLFVRQQLAAHGLDDDLKRVKRFVKTYREIRFNRDKTNYIPDFDNFTLANKVETIALLTDRKTKDLAKMSRAEIDAIYFPLIKHQVKKLERETVDFGKGYY